MALTSNQSDQPSRPVPAITEDEAAAWRQRIRADTFSNYHYCMGLALRANGEHAAAIAAFERALAINPDLPAAHYYLRDTLAACGRTKDAEDAHRVALANDPAYAERAHLAMAQAELENGHLDTAAETLRAVLSAKPGLKAQMCDTFWDLANLLERRLEYGAAAEWYEKVVEVRPDDFTARYRLARSRITQSQYGDAERHIRRALELQPLDREIWHVMSVAQLILLQPSKGIPAEQRALALAPDYGFSEYWHYAHALLCLGRMDEAVVVAARGAHVVPCPLSHGGHALALLAAGKVGEAVGLFRRAIEMSGQSNAWTLAGLGLALFQAGAADDALRCFAQAGALGTNLNWVRSGLGYVLLRQGRRGEAEATLRAGAEAEPHMIGFDLWSRPWTVETLAPVYAELGFTTGKPS